MAEPGKDHYHELGLQPDASVDEIRSAYRRLAKKYHPDRHHGDPKATERFQRIGEAYRVLSDRGRRMEYHRRAGIRIQWRAAETATRRAAKKKTAVRFADVLKRALKTGLGTFARDLGAQPAAGGDVNAELSLDTLELATGGEHTIVVQRSQPCRVCGGTGAGRPGRDGECARCLGLGEIPTSRGGKTVFVPCPDCGGTGAVSHGRCSACDGRGAVVTRVEVPVTVPPGSRGGHVIVLAGKGHAGTHGGKHGALRVRLVEVEHPAVRRDGDNLEVAVEVDVLQAFAGGEVSVPTPDGVHRLTLDPGAPAGRSYRLRGRGVSRRNGFRGDVIVRVRTRIRERIDRDARELLRKLASLPGWKVDGEDT